MMSGHVLVSSPRGVVDTSIFELDGDLKHLRAPLSDDVDAVFPPPVNSLVSVSSSDDLSSVSSVSLDDDNSWGEPSDKSGITVAKRTLFPTYWNKKGGRPRPLHAESCSITEDLTVSSFDDSISSARDSSYEQLLHRTEAVRTGSSCVRSSARRRSLFNNVYTQSEPSLTACALEKPSCIRKTQSSSAMSSERRPSILRESRFSGSSTGRPVRRASEASVSFCDEVRVEYVKPATEKWAAKGWSKYFI